MLRTKKLQKYDFDDVDPWSELVASVACDTCSTYHNVRFIADWEAIRLLKEKMLIEIIVIKID